MPESVNRPPATVVGPVYVLEAENTTVPAPTAATPPLPPPMTPEIVVEPEPASVSVLAPLATLPETVKGFAALFVQVCDVASATAR